MNDSILPKTAEVLRGFTFPSTGSTISPDQSTLPTTEECGTRPGDTSSNADNQPVGLEERSNNREYARSVGALQDRTATQLGPSVMAAESLESTPIVQRHIPQDGRLLSAFSPTTSLDWLNTSPSEKNVASYFYSVKQDSPTTPTQSDVLLSTSSPTRSPFTRRRSSQKPTLNLIIEDPSPPASVSATIGSCTKDVESPFEQGSMRVEQSAAGGDGKRLRQLGGKVARRAYSMNDLGRHERDYGKATEETAVQDDGSAYAPVREEIEHATSSAKQGLTSREQPVHVDGAGEGIGEDGPSENQSHQDVHLDDRAAAAPSITDYWRVSPKVSRSGQLEPRTLTVADVNPVTLATIVDPPLRHGTSVGPIDMQKPVAYNARLPHPAILYAALGGKDVDLSEYFDENGVFVDMMHRRVGHGGSKVLLQDGEAVTFPTVKETSSHGSPSQALATLHDSGTASTSAATMEHDGIVWKDDYVFGKSTTSGMTWSEAHTQLQLLRQIHATAQQTVTDDDQVFQQAADLIHNVAALVSLTETAQLRLAPPSIAYSSVSEYDSGHYGREQRKRQTKTSRRADQSRQGNANMTRMQPRHLGSRLSGSQTPYTWSSVPQGRPPMLVPDYSFGPPSAVSSTSYPYLTEQQQPYYTVQSDYSSTRPMAPATTGNMWHAPDSAFTTSPVETGISPSYSPGVQTPLRYKSDICRTYWIEGDCPYRLRCFFVHPPPSAHQTVARDTIAALEDPVAGLHLQTYQNQHNVQNLMNILRVGVDSISAAEAVNQPTILDLLTQAQAAPQAPGYAVMPLMNGSMVPLYPLQPAVGTTVTSTPQGHFIRLPQSQPLEHNGNQPTLAPPQPVQLITKEDIASHLQAGKAKDRASPSANRPANESKARRFSTAGPLPRKPQATFAAKARAAQQSSDNKIITMKRPASRTVKQVRQTTLQENSRDGTRLQTAAGGTGSLQIVNAINQV